MQSLKKFKIFLYIIIIYLSIFTTYLLNRQIGLSQNKVLDEVNDTINQTQERFNKTHKKLDESIEKLDENLKDSKLDDKKINKNNKENE
ncbi:Conserved hypothetical protein [Candidatus Phytoplasma australiense]|uniref:Uncharacterized protein n=1 Tax=Phytoplasma australiense TaxID=59748 RepID=B1V9F9_PHYAS|nr:Conserved hypothetical protein [Candidatus Phytoplasma australiense]